MSTNPVNAPVRPAYARDSAGNYYRLSGGPTGPTGPIGPTGPAGTGGGGGSGEQEVFGQADPPNASTNSIIWVDINDTSSPGGGSGGLDQTTADDRYIQVDGDDVKNGDLSLYVLYADTVSLNPGGRLSVGGGIVITETSQGVEFNGTDHFSAEGINYLSIDSPSITISSDAPVAIRQQSSANPQRIAGVANPVNPTDASNRQYIDTRTPPILVLGPSDPVPGDTANGTVIIRTVT